MINVENTKVLEHAKDGVIILDEKLEIAFINQSGIDILKLKENILGSNIYDVFRVYDYYTKKRKDIPIDSAFKLKVPMGLSKESALLTFDNNYIFLSASISPIIEEGVLGVIIFFKDISTLKRTENELSKFREIYENSTDTVIIVDSKWKVEYYNTKARDRYFSIRKLKGCDFWNICNYKFNKSEKENIKMELKTNKFWIGELSSTGYNELWFNTSIITLYDAIGNIVNYVIFEKDITNEKKANNILLNESKNLNSIINSAPIGMMTVRNDFKVLQINNEANRVLGVSLENDCDLLKLENHNFHKILEMISIVSNQKTPIMDNEFSIFKKDKNNNKRTWIKANATPVIISGVDCVLLSFEDETIKKEMAKQIIINERQLRLVTDNMLDIITQINIDRTIEYCSNSYKTMLGYNVEEIINESLNSIICKEDFEILDRMIAKCCESKGSIKFEIRFIHKNGNKIWVEVVMKFIEESTNLSILLFGRDVTERRVIEQEMIASKELAVASNNAKSEFLANMSHEIRTPLNGIIGMSNISLMNEKDNHQKENIQMIKHSAENLLKIINSVLDFSKIEAGKLQIEEHIFDFKYNLNRFLKPFRIQANQKEIDFVSEIDDNIPKQLVGDEIRILQVLTNLLGNAIKFTDFGVVNVSIMLSKVEENIVWIEFKVSDTGIGIKEKDRTKVFENFSQADGKITRKYGGTGLGLNIAKKLVSLMNGELSFTSTFGKGSTFIYTVPLTRSDKQFQIKQNKEIVDAGTVGVGLNILVAEDDKINQILAKRLLKRKGYNITIVNNGKEAVDIFEEGKFDLILMDIQMPYMDGLTATKLIREKEETHIPIIALTAYAIKGDKENFLKKGMDDYISKPIDLDEFYSVLEKNIILKNKKEKDSVNKILEKLNGFDKLSVDDEKLILKENYKKIDMQLKYIGAAIVKLNYEKLEERCYSFKNYITTLKLNNIRKLIFDLELHIRKENEDNIRQSFQKLVKYTNVMLEMNGKE